MNLDGGCYGNLHLYNRSHDCCHCGKYNPWPDADYPYWMEKLEPVQMNSYGSMLECGRGVHMYEAPDGDCACGYTRDCKLVKEERAMADAIQKAQVEELPELKARLSLLDADFLMEMAKVGDFGCRKYAEEDWRDNAAVTVKGRLDSLLRHIAKFQSIDNADSDNETGISHLAHVAFNAMMIWWISENRVARDNRWNLVKK